MAELVANCPRCGAKHITFNVTAANIVSIQYNWQNWYEAFAICRNCNQTTIFVLSESSSANHQHMHKVGLLNVTGSLNNFVNIEDYISQKNAAAIEPPNFLPKNIELAFREGAACLAIGCNNAAGSMFRLCVDLATKSFLPVQEVDGLNAKVRRDLGLRLPWLFASGLLDKSLEELSTCIKDDGNDGVHDGNLTKLEADDLLDFTSILLDRIFSEPERIKLAKERRELRLNQKHSIS
ncbi:DUF4145 domain-containing protein [Polynucleobacter sp. MG-28-Ekke-A2]|uniref:DUF4145 domain-containing protein n=1 Tax=Polynucleobacter sp. MG-28-Ekke-A2 TaxID=3108276 RepID=UPI002B2245B0|nr:DUF4145 domain-containing protein [Polynucleobacter sp. MG-28-Ekke-A2]MEA9602771.1 DUF4145 domain-containing protein [Polynucleobacter sp. MG-28-Ekke-A2]